MAAFQFFPITALNVQNVRHPILNSLRVFSFRGLDEPGGGLVPGPDATVGGRPKESTPDLSQYHRDIDKGEW